MHEVYKAPETCDAYYVKASPFGGFPRWQMFRGEYARERAQAAADILNYVAIEDAYHAA